MSTRKGTAVFLSDILEEAQDRMLKIMSKNEDKLKEIQNPEHTADVVGVSAVVIQACDGCRQPPSHFTHAPIA